MAAVVALAAIAVAALAALVTAAAFSRFVDPETWRFESRWVRWPRLTGAVERVAFARLEPLRALMLWLVLTAVLVAFVALPAFFFLLGEL